MLRDDLKEVVKTHYAQPDLAVDAILALIHPVIVASFKKPYAPELEDRAGKIAWRERTVLQDLGIVKDAG